MAGRATCFRDVQERASKGVFHCMLYVFVGLLILSLQEYIVVLFPANRLLSFVGMMLPAYAYIKLFFFVSSDLGALMLHDVQYVDGCCYYCGYSTANLNNISGVAEGSKCPECFRLNILETLEFLEPPYLSDISESELRREQDKVHLYARLYRTISFVFGVILVGCGVVLIVSPFTRAIITVLSVSMIPGVFALSGFLLLTMAAYLLSGRVFAKKDKIYQQLVGEFLERKRAGSPH